MNKQVKEQIRAEIERLYDGEAPAHDQQCDFDDGYFTGIAAISKFIDSLPEEQPEDFNDAFDKYMKEEWSHGTQLNDIARHFYELGQAKQMPDEQPSKSLEEAAKQFVGYDMDTDYLRDYEVGIQAFIAGANWQEKQDTADMLKSDFTVFNKCYEQGKKDIAKALLAKYKEEADKCPDADYDHDYTVAETQQYGRFMMMEDIYEEFCEPVGVTLDDLEDEK